MTEEKKFYKKNLRKIIFETILTSIGAGFCVPIITIFWNSVGMNQVHIGITQMAFTLVIFALDVPMGYIADRFDRKLLNLLGDFGAGLSFIYYAFAQNMVMCIVSECLLGVFLAMTNGVDQSFIKFNCDKIDESGQLFKRLNIKVHTARYAALLLVTILGGFIAKIDMRLCIAASFLPYFIGGIIACTIKDENAKLQSEHKNFFKSMYKSFKKIMAKKDTRAYLYSYVLGNELTHAQIWVFTPLLVLCGVPVEIVSVGWAVNYVTQVIGGKISEKMINFKTSKKFIIPVVIEFTWMLIVIINTNIVTVWLFALNGFVHGLISGNLMTSLQESVSNEVQTSIVSVASTGARLLYIPLVFVINALGNIELQYALVGTCVIFLPLCASVYMKLRKIEKSPE
jgi:MFS family permease